MQCSVSVATSFAMIVEELRAHMESVRTIKKKISDDLF